MQSLRTKGTYMAARHVVPTTTSFYNFTGPTVQQCSGSTRHTSPTKSGRGTQNQ